MLEIDLVGASHGTPHLRLYRESMAFTSLELLSKSYTKILKNKKVRAENIWGGSLESPQSRTRMTRGDEAALGLLLQRFGS